MSGAHNLLPAPLAGIGDRHASNFLLHERTATLVPIDFGCACMSFLTAITSRHMPAVFDNPLLLRRRSLCRFNCHGMPSVHDAKPAGTHTLHPIKTAAD